jgi:hypothetical protein
MREPPLGDAESAIELPRVLARRNDRGVHPTGKVIDPPRRVGLEMEWAGDHRQPHRNVGDPSGDPADHHRMEQVGLDDVKAFTPQQPHDPENLVRQIDQIGMAGEVEISDMDGNRGDPEAVHELSAVAVENDRDVKPVQVPQIPQLLERPDRSLRGGHDMADAQPPRADLGRHLSQSPMQRSSDPAAVLVNRTGMIV